MNRFTARLGFPSGAQPIISRLAAQSGELVELSAIDGEQLYVIAKDEGKGRIAVKSLLGSAMPLHATAAGKAWLSTLPINEAIAIVVRQGYRAFTQNTICDLSALRLELERVSSVGYATQDEESEAHVYAIAVPVLHCVTGVPLGTLAVVIPSLRFSSEERLKQLPALRAAADEVAALWPDGFSRVIQTGNRLPLSALARGGESALARGSP